MSHYATPDGVAAAYFAALDRLDLRALRYSDTAEVCSTRIGDHTCPGRPSPAAKRILDHEDDWLGRVRLREWQDVCSDCGQPWRPQEVEVGHLYDRTGPRTDACLRRWQIHLRLRPLAALLGPRPRDWSADRWRLALSLWRVYLRPTVGTFAATSRIAQDATSDPSWGRAKVEREIGAARAVVARRMGRRERLAA